MIPGSRHNFTTTVECTECEFVIINDKHRDKLDMRSRIVLRINTRLLTYDHDFGLSFLTIDVSLSRETKKKASSKTLMTWEMRRTCTEYRVLVARKKPGTGTNYRSTIFSSSECLEVICTSDIAGLLHIRTVHCTMLKLKCTNRI